MQLIHKIIADLLTPNDMRAIAQELDIEIINELPSSMALKLVDGARRRLRLDKLYAMLKEYRPEFDPTPHLYELVADTFSQQEMLALSDRLDLTSSNLKLDANGLIGWQNDSYMRRNRAKAAQDNSATAVFLTAVAQTKPALDLTAFGKTAEPNPPPPPPPNGKPKREKEPLPEKPPKQTYENLDLTISQINDTYLIQADYSRGGEVKALSKTINLLQDPDFVKLYDSLSNLNGNLKKARELGALLWEQLFPIKVWGQFVKTSSDAKANYNSGLRVRLRIEPPEIGMLPWEYCYDTDSNFLALNRATPLVRYIEHGSIPDKVAAPRPARVLLVSASPTDMGLITAEEEAANIRTELEELVEEGELQIKHEDHITLDKLQSLTVSFRPHILHFIGHGTFDLDEGEGFLVLEKDDGTSHEVSPDTLSVMLARTAPKVVILNACHTAQHHATNAFLGIAPALVKAEFPAVIAMQFKIPNETAARFARQMYHFLAMGLPLDAAITEARINVYAHDNTFWAIPVLFMRAEDGVIWTERE